MLNSAPVAHILVLLFSLHFWSPAVSGAAIADVRAGDIDRRSLMRMMIPTTQISVTGLLPSPPTSDGPSATAPSPQDPQSDTIGTTTEPAPPSEPSGTTSLSSGPSPGLPPAASILTSALSPPSSQPPQQPQPITTSAPVVIPVIPSTTQSVEQPTAPAASPPSAPSPSNGNGGSAPETPAASPPQPTKFPQTVEPIVIVTIGTQSMTVTQAPSLIIDTATLNPGGAPAVLGSQTVSAAPNGVVIDGSLVPFVTAPSAPEPYIPTGQVGVIITAGTDTFTFSKPTPGLDIVVAAGTTLSAGGSALVLPSQTISVAPNGAGVLDVSPSGTSTVPYADLALLQTGGVAVEPYLGGAEAVRKVSGLLGLVGVCLAVVWSVV